MGLFVGLDIAQRNTALCCLDQAGGVVLETSVPTEPASILSVLSRLPDAIDLVGLEACPLSEWLHDALSEAGHRVVCLETLHAHRFMSTRPNKTDRGDAHGIATMLRLGHYKRVHVKARASRTMRALLTGRRQVVAGALQIENAIRAILASHGIKLGRVHRGRYSERVRELCVPHAELWVAIEPMLTVRDTMRAQLRSIDRALNRTARADPLCRRFQAIPGVGPITSLAFRATIDDPTRFASSKDVPAHLGLTPRVYQSGDTERIGRITRAGDGMLRFLLVEAAISMLMVSKRWCAIKRWGVDLAKRIGMPRAVVAVARKIALVMHRMWVTGEEFRFGQTFAETPAA